MKENNNLSERIKDKIEEALTKGRAAPDTTDDLVKFFNFTIEDNSDFVTCRVSPRNFSKFSKLIFEEVSDTDIILVKGRMGSGIRMMFANSIISLNQLKRKLLNNESLSESELIMTGKLMEWRPNYATKRF